MKIARRDLYVLAGLGMIVGAFFAGAKALGSILAISYFLASTDFSDQDRSMGENLANTLKTTHVAGAVHGVGSFLVLILGGRWMLRGPKLLDRWMDGGGDGSEGSDHLEETRNVIKPQDPSC